MEEDAMGHWKGLHFLQLLKKSILLVECLSILKFIWYVMLDSVNK